MAIKIQKQPVAGRKPTSLFSSLPPPVMRPAPMPPRRLVPPPQMRRPIPQPQMSRPIQQNNAPSGLPPVSAYQTPAPIQQTTPTYQAPAQAPSGLPPMSSYQAPAPSGIPSASMFETQAPMQQQTQQPTISPVFAQPQMQQPATPSYQAPMQQPMQQPPSPFANEPGRDSNGMLIPDYGTPPPGTFLSQPVDKPGDIYGGLTPGQALGGEFTMQQPDKNQYVSIDGGRPANPMSQIPMMGKGQYDAMQQPVAGPIDPSFAQIGFGRFQDEYGNYIT